MLIASQNLKHYLTVSPTTILRFNLAWLNSLDELVKLMDGVENDVFLDLPIGRTKPPNNSYTIDELKPFFHKYKNIKYLAVSNIESEDDLKYYLDFDHDLIIIPKIETKRGVENIANVVAALDGQEKKIIMLDHDDLFSSLIKNKVHPDEFPNYIDQLVDYCAANDVTLLRTRGVIFSS